jgi:hypothetical protein
MLRICHQKCQHSPSTRGRKWTLDAIAKSIYIIAHDVQDHQEMVHAKGERVSTNSKIIALIIMYSFFITKINLAEAVRQLQATGMDL